MARIKIAGMPRDAKISRDEMRNVTGGISVTNNHYVDPYAISITNNHRGNPYGVIVNNNHHRGGLVGALPIPVF